MIETTIRQALITAGIARVYPISAPQDAELPYCVIWRIGADADMTLDGDASLRQKTIQVSYFSNSSTDALQKADIIADTLIGFAGDSIQNVELVTEGSSYEYDTTLYHVFLRFDVWHTA
ncbi:tail completion protein gp17 [Paludibaculum fermentans]|uniref:tail completion protein gp17 n=1 Tax=Paludibaculum fermentans TaxID=1473598 RepID=UPI003EBB7E4B